MKRAFALILVLCLVAPLSACGEPSQELKDVGEKAGATWGAVKKYAAKKKDDAVAYFSKEMEGVGPKLAAARAKAVALGPKAAQALEGKWHVVAEKFEAMKGATGDKWDDARDGFTAAYEAFIEEIDKSKEGE